MIGELDALVGGASACASGCTRSGCSRSTAAGRQAEALEAYRDARAALVEQIGVEPGAELRRAARADPRAGPGARPARGAPSRRPRRRRARRRARRSRALLVVAAAAAARRRRSRSASSACCEPDSLPRHRRERTSGVIDPGSGRITDQYRVGHGPEAVAAGAGSVWVANRLDGTVSRIDRDRADRDDRRRRRAERPRVRRRVALGGGRRRVAGSRRSRRRPTRSCSEIEVGNAAHAVAVGYGAVWVASAVDATSCGSTRRAAGPGRRSRSRRGRRRWRRGRARSGSRARPRRAWSGSTLARARRWPTFAWATGPAASPSARARCGWPTAATGPSRASTRTREVTETVRVGREPRAVAVDGDGVWVANAGDGTRGADRLPRPPA